MCGRTLGGWRLSHARLPEGSLRPLHPRMVFLEGRPGRTALLGEKAMCLPVPPGSADLGLGEKVKVLLPSLLPVQTVCHQSAPGWRPWVILCPEVRPHLWRRHRTTKMPLTSCPGG